MIAVIVNSAVTYGLFRLFGNKRTKYAHHVIFWVSIWIISVVISFGG